MWTLGSRGAERLGFPGFAWAWTLLPHLCDVNPTGLEGYGQFSALGRSHPYKRLYRGADPGQGFRSDRPGIKYQLRFTSFIEWLPEKGLRLFVIPLVMVT